MRSAGIPASGLLEHTASESLEEAFIKMTKGEGRDHLEAVSDSVQ